MQLVFIRKIVVFRSPNLCRQFWAAKIGNSMVDKLKVLLKNSKVFEQKGDLLNFKANIDPMAVLSRVKLSQAKSS